MSNSPLIPTSSEFEEIVTSPELQEVWGAENPEAMMKILEGCYIVKLDFINGSPGYTGDLFLIQSDHLASEIPVIRLYRGNGGQLVMLRE